MIKHQLTKYTTNNKKYAEAWLQINIFGKAFVFNKKRIEIQEDEKC